MSTFRLLLAFALLTLGATTLSACNTLGGAVEDVSDGVDAMSDDDDD